MGALLDRAVALLDRAFTRARRHGEPPRPGSGVPPEPEAYHFTCNVCGSAAWSLAGNIARETPSCATCGSTVRMRALMHVLSQELFGRNLVVPDFPVDEGIVGLGMSDWEEYAGRWAEKFSYTNRFYGREPRLDITAPPADLAGTFDFVVSTDVFEHVAPPVVSALRNLRALLKPGGVVVFSVPYMSSGDNIEHFPDLFDHRLEDRDGQRCLVNRTREGRVEVFEDLVFHGGEGLTLEMRVFSEPALLAQIEEAGFAPPTIYGATLMEFGIRWDTPLSLPMALRAA